MLDYWVQVLSVRLPLLYTLLGVTFELFVSVLMSCFCLLIGLQFLPQFLLSPHLLLIHLTLQLISIFLVKVLSELVVVVFSLL